MIRSGGRAARTCFEFLIDGRAEFLDLFAGAHVDGERDGAAAVQAAGSCRPRNRNSK